MYNDMAANLELLEGAMRAVKAFDARLPLMVMATANPEPHRQLAEKMGVTLWFETFADRAYEATGHLASRRLPGAVHHDQATIVAQAVALAKGEALTARDGSALQLPCDTLCVHGDNPESVAAVRAIREAFTALESA